MGKQSGYLKRKQREIGVWRQAEKDTYIQFMTDTLMITLNNPEYVGKDVLDEIPEEELFPTEEEMARAGQGGEMPTGEPTDTAGQITQEGDFAAGTQPVSEKSQGGDSENEGAAPEAAPAATKLPQDMSEEEKQRAQKVDVNLPKGDGDSRMDIGWITVNGAHIHFAELKGNLTYEL